jgi:7-cyano-7-deazaguanine synthase in queuosine biosynthesis
MAGRAVAQRAVKRTTRLRCRVLGVRAAFEPREASFDFAAGPVWAADGALGAKAWSPRVLDLLDLVGGIYRVESQIPPRPTNPAKEWQIEAPVRDVDFWSREGGAPLASVLGFLNRARWSFAFRERGRTKDVEVAAEPRVAVRDVVLFSGGMDSTCGAGVHPGPPDAVQLVSFYSNQKELQRSLASELGYPPPVQWRLQGQRGKEGMDLIRALMFLTLGAAVAESFGVATVFQYENGVLAMAIPPAGAMIPTRHAHPELHRRLEVLWEAVFGRRIEIRNPFALMTKREEVETFVRTVSSDRADAILSRTQTCWRLSQAHVGGKAKRPGQPCGVCTPCIVRRTARPLEPIGTKSRPGYQFDLKKESVRRHPKLGMTFRAYLELIGLVFGTDDDRALIEQLAPEARALIGGPAGPTADQAVSVLRRFADEFCDTFAITISRSRA